MGLDNGINIRTNHKLPGFEELEWDKEGYTHAYEIVYWRKYWNLRNELVNKLHLYEDDSMSTYNDGQKMLTWEDLKTIYYTLQEYLHWHQDESIWEKELVHKRTKQAIRELRRFMFFFKLYHLDINSEIYFYDSY